jgi:hypothetical protein
MEEPCVCFFIIVGDGIEIPPSLTRTTSYHLVERHQIGNTG